MGQGYVLLILAIYVNICLTFMLIGFVDFVNIVNEIHVFFNALRTLAANSKRLEFEPEGALITIRTDFRPLFVYYIFAWYAI